jgi:hypothetical protein
MENTLAVQFQTMNEGYWKEDTKSWSDLIGGSDGDSKTPSSRHASYHVSGRKGAIRAGQDFTRMRRSSSSSEQTIGSGDYEPLRKDMLDLRDRVHPHMNKPNFIEALKVKTTDSHEGAFDVDFPDLPLRWDSFKANDKEFFMSMFSGAEDDVYESRVPARTPSPLGRRFHWHVAHVFRRITAPFFRFSGLFWACGATKSDVVPM